MEKARVARRLRSLNDFATLRSKPHAPSCFARHATRRVTPVALAFGSPLVLHPGAGPRRHGPDGGNGRIAETAPHVVRIRQDRGYERSVGPNRNGGRERVGGLHRLRTIGGTEYAAVSPEPLCGRRVVGPA